jgi:hypothetical protein
MDKETASKVNDVALTAGTVAGHIGEMAGQAVQAAANTVGCPVGKTAGKAIEAAGKAWGDTAARVIKRDAKRLSE